MRQSKWWMVGIVSLGLVALACGDSDPAPANPSNGANGSGNAGQAGDTGAAGQSEQGGFAGQSMNGGSGMAGMAGTGGQLQCGGLKGTPVSQQTFPEQCNGLSEQDSLACVEQRFWYAFRDSYENRPQVYELMGKTIDEWQTKADPKMIATLYFRRGQLGMAMALENNDDGKILKVKPDFEKALEFDPQHPIAPTWLDTMDMAFAMIAKDWVKAQELFDKALKNIDLCPVGNIPSLTGTTIGLPLSTGIPQQTIVLADKWVCEGVDWCTENTWKAPYAVAGMRYHIGESYVRVGQKEKALAYFKSATEAPDYKQWPYASFVDDKIKNIDDFIDSFKKMGDEEPVFNMVYANSEFGCKFCHGTH
jgi:tetratricopeptide (TPR) repeat protein